jgi:hypothetical protein
VGKLVVSGFKVSATGSNPVWDVGLGREKGIRYGTMTYLNTDCGLTQLRTYKLPFIYNHNVFKINYELKLTNLLSIYHNGY